MSVGQQEVACVQRSVPSKLGHESEQSVDIGIWAPWWSDSLPINWLKMCNCQMLLKTITMQPKPQKYCIGYGEKGICGWVI